MIRSGSRLSLAHYPDIPIEFHIGFSVDKLQSLAHSIDLFVLTSLVEGFGLVILENMACGLPVIATPHSGAPDVIEEGRHGFIIPIRSAEALAEKLAWGIEHRQELFEMGQAAAVQAQRFSWTQFRRNIQNAYCSMIAEVS